VSSKEQIQVQQVVDEQTISRVNEFFNSEIIKDELNRFIYRNILDRAFERRDRRLFFVEADEDLVAAIMVWCESQVLDPEEAQIRLIAVHPQHRNRGIGRELSKQAEKFASASNMEKVSADVAQDSSTLGFWTACGYEPVFTWETDSGREMSRVEKTLS
jgi:ribosomal protein S18 acetylase RimI-like enzyme